MKSGYLRKFFFHTISAVSFCIAVLSAYDAAAQPQYIFPGSNPTFTGGANSWPLNANPSSGSNKCQWLYLPADFSPTPSGAMLITTVYIKPTNSVSFTFTNLQVSLANVTMNTLTSGTWNSGLTLSYNPATVSVTTTANSWYAFTLSTPFYYSGGNLLFELTHTSSSSSGITINQFTVSGRNGRMYGSSSSASSSGADAATAVFGFDAMPANCSGTPLTPVITSAAMSAAAPLCGGTTTINATNPNGMINGISLMWQQSSSSTGPFTNVTSGTGATTTSYTTGPITATTWFRLGATCSNSSITSYSAPYQVLAGAPQPGAISGRPSFCPGDTANYNVPLVFGTTYAWTLPSGWTGSSTTNNILATMGTTGGTISVTATNACGGPSVARTMTIVPGSAPSTPTAVNGPGFVCPNSSQTYTTPSVPGANSYIWSLPSGWTGTSISNSITLLTGTNSGNISVRAANGCGNSNAIATAVTVTNTLPSPGAITTSSPNGQYCAGQLYAFSINPVPGATSYQWTMPSGWSGTNSGISIQAFAGTGVGQIAVTAYVSCATSPTSVLAVTGATSLTPSVSITGPANLCSGIPLTFTANGVNAGTSPAYQWRRNGTPVLGFGNTFMSSSLTSGDVISVSLASSLSCRTVDTVYGSFTANLTPSVTPGVTINSNPVISICSGTDVNFVTFSIGTGTAPTYQWFRNGLQIPGATATTYTSSTLNNGDTISVQMTGNAPCSTIPVASSNKVGMTVNPAIVPSVTVSASTTAVAPGVTVTFTATYSGGGTTPTFQWMLNNVDIPGATGNTYTSSTLGHADRIAVRMQSYDPCASVGVVNSNEVIMLSATSVAGVNNWEGELSLYPNPTSGRFSVTGNWGAAHIGKTIRLDVMNVVGQSVYHADITPDKTKWNHEVNLGAGLSNGHYTLRLSSGDGMRAAIPFVLNR